MVVHGAAVFLRQARSLRLACLPSALAGESLESVQKLREEPRKEYAAGILLFSDGACIRVI